MELTQTPVAETGMLIRKPVHEVFEAFVDGEAITKFWFTRSTGRLLPGAEVTWFWDMYGASAEVKVLEFEPDNRVLFEWPGAYGANTVEWRFISHELGTFVGVENSGFGGSEDEQVAQAIDSTQGFTIVLCGAKAYLEHGIELGLVLDRFPPGIEE